MKQTYSYKIIRGCLWFAQNDVVSCEKFQGYFTPQAIRSLIENGYIQVLTERKIEKP